MLRVDRKSNDNAPRFCGQATLSLLVSTTCILIFSPCALAAPPPNDECEGAIEIVGEGVFPFDNTNTTAQYPWEIDHDVWYCWTSTCSSAATVDTCAGTVIDTTIGVWDECDCPPSGWLANDPYYDGDECALQSIVTFGAQVGHDYLIQIGTPFGIHGGGVGTFTVACGDGPVPPCQHPSENCQQRDGWNALTSDRTDYFVADDFTPAADGEITEICWWGTYLGEDNALPPPDSFEVLYVIDGGGLAGQETAGLFSQEAGTLTVEGPTRTYRLLADTDVEYEYKATHAPVPVSAGQCYWVEITNKLTGSDYWLWEVAPPGNGRALQDGRADTPPHGYDRRDARTADLSFCLNIPLGDPQACRPIPENDACVNSLSISEGETFFDTTGASTDGPAQRCTLSESCCGFPLGDHQIHRDIWFDYVAPCSALLTAQLCGSPFDTKLAIYEGPTCPPDVYAAACNDNGCDEVLAQQSYVERLVTQGQDYKIRVGGYTAPLEGNCGMESDDPGCGDSVCEAAVCAIDASCCVNPWWDSLCAEIARDVCGGRSGPGTIQLDLTATDPTNMDLSKFAVFSTCYTGSCTQPPCGPALYPGPCCLTNDFDDDGDVDADDHAAFLTGFSGP